MTISYKIGACFNCILPGQQVPNVWQVNGIDVKSRTNAEGYLIYVDPDELFRSLPMMIMCGNNNTNVSALITYAGKN